MTRRHRMAHAVAWPALALLLILLAAVLLAA